MDTFVEIHCKKYQNFSLFSGMEILWKREFLQSLRQIAQNFVRMRFHKISTPGD